MLRINLLEKITENDKERYETTGKGMDFLQRYREITELLKNDDEINGKNGVKIPPQHLLKKSQNLC
jgi:predicted MarR family transcription regulator